MNPDVADASAVDPYAPPAATLVDETTAPARVADRYYVVSAAKYWTLELLSAGTYTLVWMYLHWAAIKRATKGDEWPVMRALFPVFFTHSLAEDIEHCLRRAQVAHAWSPAGMATGAVVAMIVGNVADRLPTELLSEDIAFAISLAMVPVAGWFKWRIQVAANLACGDEAGGRNARFTAANIAWIVVFGLLWALVGLGMVVELLGLDGA